MLVFQVVCMLLRILFIHLIIKHLQSTCCALPCTLWNMTRTALIRVCIHVFIEQMQVSLLWAQR